jgi:hypothetical protein
VGLVNHLGHEICQELEIWTATFYATKNSIPMDSDVEKFAMSMMEKRKKNAPKKLWWQCVYHVKLLITYSKWAATQQALSTYKAGYQLYRTDAVLFFVRHQAASFPFLKIVLFFVRHQAVSFPFGIHYSSSPLFPLTLGPTCSCQLDLSILVNHRPKRVFCCLRSN